MVPEVSPRLAQVLTLARVAVLLGAEPRKAEVKEWRIDRIYEYYWVINAGNSAVTAEQVVISTSYYGH